MNKAARDSSDSTRTLRSRRSGPHGRALPVIALAVFCTALLSFPTYGGAAALQGPRLFRAVTVVWTQSTLPPFRWAAARGADHYEFELAADRSFSSPVLSYGGHFTTRNTVATVDKAVPDGKYWWRVRAVSKGGSVSGWSIGTVTKRWSAAPALAAPTNGGQITYPRDPLILSWKPVPGAANYSVALASDPRLAALVGGRRTTTGAASFVPPLVLADGTYYWAVTPLDAQGNEGRQSSVRSFTWRWPSGVKTHFADLVDAPEVVDPQLSWDTVPGAARYELDVNFSKDFAPGSRVCCSAPVIATSYSPTKLLPNNTYYWRVRAVNANGKAGDWSVAESFMKTFDTAPTVPAPSVKGLHVRDNFGDSGSSPPGVRTSVPILVWNPVPGASGYEVDVTPYVSGACDWTASSIAQWRSLTAVPAWTPLGTGLRANKPFSSPATVTTDLARLSNGTAYCSRV